MTEIFLYTLNTSITASIIAVVVLLLRLILKKAPKWISVLLWGLVAIRLICPFVVESRFSLMPKTDWIAKESNLSSADLIYGYVPADPDTISIDTISDSSLYKDITVTYHTIDAPGIELHKSVSPLFLLSCIWALGIAALLLHTIISTVRLRRRIGTAIYIRDNVWESSAVDSPFVLGVFYPQIYVPRGMTEEMLAYVIAHEKAHILRRDHLWKPLGFILLTVHWFNPVMWLAYILLCRDIEMACDERVVSEYDEAQRADYSEALLECSIKGSMISACPLAFGEVGVKQRIQSVLYYKKPAFWMVMLAVIACAATAVCFLTNPEIVINTSVTGIRFPYDNPGSAETCTVELNGKIQYDTFRGTVTVDGRKIETSIDMDRDTPSMSYYEGPRLKNYGLFYILDSMFSKFAFEITESDEYVICGMSLDSFEKEMAKKNYYVAYLHDVVLYDISSLDKEKVLSDIYTEGRTVVIYGKKLDIDEINRTFYSGNYVMGTLNPVSSSGVSVYYACASTCLEGKVYVGYYSATFESGIDEAEIASTVDDNLDLSALRRYGYELRKSKLELHADEIKPNLTVEDVIKLSGKGNSLTWSDFDKFNYIETGSGLYIRVYKIDENFELWIGGSYTDTSPMYIRLTAAENIDIYIDIRQGSDAVRDFILLKSPMTFTGLITAYEVWDNDTVFSGRLDLNLVEYIESSDTARIYELGLPSEYMVNGYYIHDENESTTVIHIPIGTEFLFCDKENRFIDTEDSRYKITDAEKNFISTQDFVLFTEYLQTCNGQALAFDFHIQDKKVTVSEIMPK